MANKIILPGPIDVPLEDLVLKNGSNATVDINGNPVDASNALTLEGDDKATIRANIDALTLEGFTSDQLLPDVSRRVKLLAKTSHGGKRLLVTTESNELYYRGDDQFFGSGQEDTGTPGQFVKIATPPDTIGKTIKSIHNGSSCSFILYTDGTVYSWGQNTFGQLGIGNFSNTFITNKLALSNIDKLVVAVSSIDDADVIFALSASGQLFAWGVNNNGQLGIGNNVNQNAPILVSVDGGKVVKDIFASGSSFGSSFAITTDETVYATGFNNRGQLGLADTVARNIFTEITIFSGIPIIDIQMAVGFGPVTGEQNTFFLTADNRIFACGLNDSGSLGVGNAAQQTTPTIQNHDFVTTPAASMSIDPGANYGHFVTTAGQLYGWGRNTFGNLGDGTTNNRSSPLFIKSGVVSVQFLSGGNDLSNLAYATLIITTSNEVQTTGFNDNGNLGQGSNDQSTVFIAISLPSANLITQITSDGADGLCFVMVVLSDGRLYGWGDNGSRAIVGAPSSVVIQKPTLMNM